MTGKSKTAAVLPDRIFASQQEWHAWLDENHAASRGVWLQLARKEAATSTVSYAEALEIALCYGWIDGQKQAHSTEFWLQKFTPRAPRSVWSKNNKEKALALIEAGKMHPAGLTEIECAKRDGRWDAAYASASKATVPEDFQAALDAHPQALAFFATLDSRNRYGILYRIQTAKKAETRDKRIAQFLEMLIRRETLY